MGKNEFENTNQTTQNVSYPTFSFEITDDKTGETSFYSFNAPLIPTLEEVKRAPVIKNSEELDILYEEARLMHKKSELEKCIKLYAAILEIDPFSYEAYFYTLYYYALFLYNHNKEEVHGFMVNRLPLVCMFIIKKELPENDTVDILNNYFREITALLLFFINKNKKSFEVLGNYFLKQDLDSYLKLGKDTIGILSIYAFTIGSMWPDNLKFFTLAVRFLEHCKQLSKVVSSANNLTPSIVNPDDLNKNANVMILVLSLKKIETNIAFAKNSTASDVTFSGSMSSDELKAEYENARQALALDSDTNPIIPALHYSILVREDPTNWEAWFYATQQTALAKGGLKGEIDRNLITSDFLNTTLRYVQSGVAENKQINVLTEISEQISIVSHKYLEIAKKKVEKYPLSETNRDYYVTYLMEMDYSAKLLTDFGDELSYVFGAGNDNINKLINKNIEEAAHIIRAGYSIFDSTPASRRQCEKEVKTILDQKRSVRASDTTMTIHAIDAQDKTTLNREDAEDGHNDQGKNTIPKTDFTSTCLFIALGLWLISWDSVFWKGVGWFLTIRYIIDGIKKYREKKKQDNDH